MTDPFDNATYFGAEGDELLHFESPEEYILDVFEGELPVEITTEGIEAALDDIAGIEVIAFVRATIDSKEMRRWAANAADGVAEAYACEYDDPNDGDGFRDVLPHLERAFHAVTMRVMREYATVWRCHEVARRKYSAEDVKTIWVADQAQ